LSSDLQCLIAPPRWPTATREAQQRASLLGSLGLSGTFLARLRDHSDSITAWMLAVLTAPRDGVGESWRIVTMLGPPKLHNALV
jgi:hypothetical protein